MVLAVKWLVLAVLWTPIVFAIVHPLAMWTIWNPYSATRWERIVHRHSFAGDTGLDLYVYTSLVVVATCWPTFLSSIVCVNLGAGLLYASYLEHERVGLLPDYCADMQFVPACLFLFGAFFFAAAAFSSPTYTAVIYGM
jgi:hypothetical protein